MAIERERETLIEMKTKTSIKSTQSQFPHEIANETNCAQIRTRSNFTIIQMCLCVSFSLAFFSFRKSLSFLIVDDGVSMGMKLQQYLRGNNSTFVVTTKRPLTYTDSIPPKHLSSSAGLECLISLYCLFFVSFFRSATNTILFWVFPRILLYIRSPFG